MTAHHRSHDEHADSTSATRARSSIVVVRALAAGRLEEDPDRLESDDNVEERGAMLHVVEVVLELLERLVGRARVRELHLRPAGDPRSDEGPDAVEGDRFTERDGEALVARVVTPVPEGRTGSRRRQTPTEAPGYPAPGPDLRSQIPV